MQLRQITEATAVGVDHQALKGVIIKIAKGFRREPSNTVYDGSDAIMARFGLTPQEYQLALKHRLIKQDPAQGGWTFDKYALGTAYKAVMG